MANVVFLWHMHQPYYVDTCTRQALMPWVRLHCQKGYLDMISLLEDHPSIRANFNLSPVLLLQIRELAEKRVSDRWLEWARKPAAALDPGDKFALLENFFKLNWDTMVRPFPRFWELLNKRGMTFYPDDVRRGLRYFSVQEFRDLQTLFNLAWFGYTARRQYPELEELRRKGRLFTEEEKNRVLDIQEAIVGSVIGKYREAEERGQVELTTNAFFHPILPLVYDSDVAARAMPGRTLPQRFHQPEDAQAQLALAIEQHAALFGKAPRGVWPSEGGVSPELVPLLRTAGIDYFCSDEEVLMRSLGREIRPGCGAGGSEVFEAWGVTCHGQSVQAIFRHRALSDYIGFMAARHDQSAKHLADHMRHLVRLQPGESAVIPLILDGENAWEHFPDSGEGFLRAFYRELESDRQQLACRTMEDYLREHPPRRRLEHLHTGSWIGASFDIWIGEPEENRAWDLLGRTRHFLGEQMDAGHLPADKECQARRELYAAEGSDWFWWYGPDFSTANDALFDELFRIHLRNVYTICGHMPPAALGSALGRGARDTVWSPPSAMINPPIDGRQRSFFDWTGAGIYRTREKEGNSASATAQARVDALYFGNDSRHLFLKVQFIHWLPLTVGVEFMQPSGFRLRPVCKTVQTPFTWMLSAADKREFEIYGTSTGREVELAVPLEALGIAPGDLLSFQIRFFRDGIEDGTLPEDMPLEFRLLDEESALAQWRV